MADFEPGDGFVLDQAFSRPDVEAFVLLEISGDKGRLYSRGYVTTDFEKRLGEPHDTGWIHAIEAVRLASYTAIYNGIAPVPFKRS